VHNPHLLIPLTWYQQLDKLGNSGSCNKAPAPSTPPSLAHPVCLTAAHSAPALLTCCSSCLTRPGHSDPSEPQGTFTNPAANLSLITYSMQPMVSRTPVTWFSSPPCWICLHMAALLIHVGPSYCHLLHVSNGLC